MTRGGLCLVVMIQYVSVIHLHIFAIYFRSFAFPLNYTFITMILCRCESQVCFVSDSFLSLILFQFTFQCSFLLAHFVFDVIHIDFVEMKPFRSWSIPHKMPQRRKKSKKKPHSLIQRKKDSEIQKEISTTIIIMFCQHRSKKPHSESIRKCCVCCRFQCFEIERVPCERCTKSTIQIKTEHRQTCFELVNKWFNGIYTRNEATS